MPKCEPASRNRVFMATKSVDSSPTNESVCALKKLNDNEMRAMVIFLSKAVEWGVLVGDLMLLSYDLGRKAIIFLYRSV